jgi:hypothetical protein
MEPELLKGSRVFEQDPEILTGLFAELAAVGEYSEL